MIVYVNPNSTPVDIKTAPKHTETDSDLYQKIDAMQSNITQEIDHKLRARQLCQEEEDRKFAQEFLSLDSTYCIISLSLFMLLSCVDFKQ